MEKKSQNEDGTVSEELFDKLVTLALEIGKSFKMNLDFSNESIKDVEKILDQIHRDYKKTGNGEGLYGVALEFGAYIVRTIQKNFNYGVWYKDHPKLGEESFPLFFPDNTVAFPVAWCHKRIVDGKGDDVWMKYRHFILKDKTLTKKNFWNIFK